MLGGGMRQAGIIAAAGLYALENQVDDLALDHARAQHLAKALSECSQVDINLDSVHTNIVLFTPLNVSPKEACAALNDRVRVLPFGQGQIRAVLHRNISDSDLEMAIKVLKDYFA